MTDDPLEINSFELPEEIAALEQLAAGRTVLEVGTFHGFSAVVMARAGALRVHAVDWHRGGAELGERDTLETAWSNLYRFGVRDLVVLHVGRSEVVLPLLRPQSFDMAFIDGEHDQAPRDTALCLPLLRPGGVLLWHDSGSWRVPTAVAGAARLLGAEVERPGGSLAMVRLPE